MAHRHRIAQRAFSGDDARGTVTMGEEAVINFGLTFGLNALFSLLNRERESRWETLQARL